MVVRLWPGIWWQLRRGGALALQRWEPVLLKKDDELWTCDKYDRKRVNTLTILRVMTASCFLGAILSAFGAYGIMIVLLWIGTIFLVYSISFARIRSYIHEGRCLWRGTDRGVTMVVPREIIVWELVPWGLMVLGLPGAALVHALGAPAVAGGAVGGAGICGSVYLVLMFWEGGPEAERILLDGKRISFTRINGEQVSFDWSQEPVVQGGRGPSLFIGTSDLYEGWQFPMAYVPVSSRQIQRLVDAFSPRSSRQWRRRLDGPHALQTVLDVLEPTEEEYSDSSWTWARPEVSQGGAWRPGRG